MTVSNFVPADGVIGLMVNRTVSLCIILNIRNYDRLATLET